MQFTLTHKQLRQQRSAHIPLLYPLVLYIIILGLTLATMEADSFIEASDIDSQCL